MGSRMAKKKKPAKEFKPKFERIPAALPRLPKAVEETLVIEMKPTLYRCIAENTLQITRHECGRRFGPGQIVDLDESIGKGLKLREHVRHACWEPIGAGGNDGIETRP